MTITAPGIVSDDAVLAAIRAIDGNARAALEAAGPHLIRDWVTAVLRQHPHITPGKLAELADGLLPEGTP